MKRLGVKFRSTEAIAELKLTSRQRGYYENACPNSAVDNAGPTVVRPQMATVAPAAIYRAASSGFDSEGSAAREVVALEKRTWETAQRRDIGAYAAFMSDDFVLVNEEGVSNKKQAVDSLNDLTIQRYRLADIRLHDFSPNAVMIAYQVNVKLGGQASEIVSYRSLLWVKRQGRWLNVFDGPCVIGFPGLIASKALMGERIGRLR